jgi:hypothetical protein
MSHEFYNGLQAGVLLVCTKELVQILQYCQSKSVCTDRKEDLNRLLYTKRHIKVVSATRCDESLDKKM